SGGSTGTGGGGGAPGTGGKSSADASSDAPSTDAPSGNDGGDTTAAKNLGSTSGGLLVGAASSDGSAMLIILAPSGLLWSHYETASGWSVPANLPGGANADVPQVGMDAAGNTFVAWTCPVDGGRTLCVSRYAHATASWGSVQHPDDYNQFSNGFA